MCGSCWAFSSTGALEGQHFRKTGKLVSLSEQNLDDCTVSYGNHGCRGGWMEHAFNYIKDNGGIDTEESYLYEGKKGACRYRSKDRAATVVGYVDIQQGDEDGLKAAIATIGPISIVIDSSDMELGGSFQFYSKGKQTLLQYF